MTSRTDNILLNLKAIVPGPWEQFEQLSANSYRLNLGSGNDLVVERLTVLDARDYQRWQASFTDCSGDTEIELSTPALSPEDAVRELLGRARRLTMLTCRTGDKAQNLDDFLDATRGHLYAVMDSVFTKAGLIRVGGPDSPEVLRPSG